jgi:poly-beta-hydroxybutyrate-responsive repressor
MKKDTKEFDSFYGSSSDLTRGWLLAILRQSSMHGYQMLQTLSTFGLASFDPATVYRILRRLEKEGLVKSIWETGDFGPAKRVYSLTDLGENFLNTWASALEQYQDVLNRFFEIYSDQITNSGKKEEESNFTTKSDT